jgi:hypothetical protein
MVKEVTNILRCVGLWAFALGAIATLTMKHRYILGNRHLTTCGPYIGQGLRVDLERFESEAVTALVASLKRRGVSEAAIDETLSEVVHA